MRRPMLLFALLLALPAVVLAQAGRLSGKVTDTDGEPLADVEVTIINVDTEATVSTTSSRKGRFALAVRSFSGNYEVVLRKEGYATLRESIKLQPGDPIYGEWQLQAGGSGGLVPGLDLTAEEMAAKQVAVELYNAGAQAYNAGDLAAAAGQFDAALAEDPELVEAIQIGAVVNLRIENYARALELAEALLTQVPGDVSGQGVRYDSLTALGRTEEADVALDEMVETDPGEETAKRAYNRALAMARNNDLAGAIPRLEQALAMSPELAPAWGLMGDLQIALENYDRAIECGDKLVTIEGSLERGLSLRHRALEAKGDTEGAREALKALAEVTPDAVMKSLFERGKDLFDRNDTAGAAAVFVQVLELQPDNPRAHYRLGLALLSAGDTAEARSHLERFLELAPDDSEAQAARDMLTYLD